MWVFLSDAFLSIVAIADDPGRLLVRARFPGDIERVFPAAETRMTLRRDYRYRALVPRQEVAQALAEQAMRINYGNFKNSVHDDAHHDAYLCVWSVMMRAQNKTKPEPIPEGAVA